MNTRTIAASVLTLGLLASGALAQVSSMNYNDFRCSEIERRDGDFVDCKTDGNSVSTKAFSAPAVQSNDGNYYRFFEESTKSKAGLQFK